MSTDASESVEVRKRIKQLENQNLKLKKILQTAVDIAEEDTSGLPTLKFETEALSQRIGDLEKQKKSLEQEIISVRDGDVSLTKLVEYLEREQIMLRSRLDDVLNEIKKGDTEIEDLKTEDVQLKKALYDLEREKAQLIEKLEKIELVKSSLSRESLILRDQISEIDEKKSSITETLKGASSKENHSEEEIVSHFKYIEQTYKEYIKALEEQNNMEEKISQLETKREQLSNEAANNLDSEPAKSQLQISNAIVTSNTNMLHTIQDVRSKLETSLNNKLMRTLEEPNNVAQIDIQISELENQRDILYEQLQQSLEHSTKEIEELTVLVSDPEIKRIVHEIEIQKAILLCNLKLLKPNTMENYAPEITNESSSRQTVPTISELEMRYNKLSYDGSDVVSTTSCAANEQKESTQHFESSCSSRDNHQKLEEEVCRLENERKVLLQQLHSISETSAQRFEERQLQTQSELHSTFMREESSQELVLSQRYDDDATNQLYPDDDARLRQRIRELEIENRRIKSELDVLLKELNMKKEHLKEKIDELEMKESLLKSTKQQSVAFEHFE